MPRKLSPETPRDQLIALRAPLVDLHRTLLETERRQYEGAHGRVSATELLQLALNGEQFAWLHRISATIVRIDELIAADEGPGAADVHVVSAHVRLLLRPSPEGTEFERRYDHAVQSDPAVLLAHRHVMQTLPPEPAVLRETVH